MRKNFPLNVVVPGDDRLSLYWVRVTGRERATGKEIHTFHILLRAETFLRFLVDNTDEGITFELRMAEESYAQPVPLCGPGLRLIL